MIIKKKPKRFGNFKYFLHKMELAEAKRKKY